MSQAVRIMSALALLVWLAGCSGAGTASQEARERDTALHRKARTAEQSGDLKEAIRLYHEVLIEEPRSFSAHFQLATLLHDFQEDYVGAIYHYKQYLYLRPKSEKSTLANERIRIAEQLLAPQILRKVGDSVQGISQAHLLKETDRLNRLITGFEAERAAVAEQREKEARELEALRGENARLREILVKMRVSDVATAPAEPLRRRVAEAAAAPAASAASAASTLDAAAARALRAEAAALARGAAVPAPAPAPAAAAPSADEVLKAVQRRVSGTPAPAPAAPAAVKRQTETPAPQPAPQPVVPPPPPPPVRAEPDKAERLPASLQELLGREKAAKEKERAARPAGEQRTYVVQPGDTLFRVAEKFYGDSAHWKRIRDANRARIDPDGRIRAGQSIVVP